MANAMNCILYLVRSSEKDVEDFNKSLELLEKNLLPYTSGTDLLVFVEDSFEEYKSLVKTNVSIRYETIEFKFPDYPQEILDQIPEFYPHPTHGNGPIEWGHPGFSMGYRHMCRFFSGELYNQKAVQEYEYYLRFDTDSYIHTPLNYDIFEWAKVNECYYGYIAPAVQKDNLKVVEGLWNSVNELIPENFIEEGMMFYTNFELGKVDWFLTSEYMRFYNELDKTGGFYTKRWGDAPIKYLGINLLMEPEHIIPVQGFTYQHGAVYTV
jgi:alpha 1,2-mannosyltransferase